ncbi:MAG: hypothetical protein RL362_688 [Bacteroidota bacterium]|jgi:hypothetical protein
MAFTLTKIRTGEQQNFTVREILELLGDPINNEIVIRGESYRINNVQGDLSSGGSDTSTWRADWQKIPITVGSSGQTQFSVNVNTNDPEGLFLAVNGAIYDYGVNSAFDISSGTLNWHGGFNLEPTDHVYIKFLTLTNN